MFNPPLFLSILAVTRSPTSETAISYVSVSLSSTLSFIFTRSTTISMLCLRVFLILISSSSSLYISSSILTLVKPSFMIEEKYFSALEEETLIQEIERRPKCPGCRREIQSKWILCPACHTKLMKKCVKYEEVLELPWTLCPYCGAPQHKPQADTGRS